MLPDLDSLALFVKAAETRNLTRAAESSFITVPAASRRLSLLEHQFKAQLFERHSRGLELTAAGERLLLLAREVLAAVHHMRAEMTNYGAGHTAVLRIHGNTSAMAQFLPADIASFQPQHPDIRLVLEECWSEEAVRRVRSGGIKVTKHSKPFQIAPRGEDDFYLILVGLFQHLSRRCPKQHPVLGLVHRCNWRGVARIHEIETRIKNAAGIFKGRRAPA